MGNFLPVPVPSSWSLPSMQDATRQLLKCCHLQLSVFPTETPAPESEEGAVLLSSKHCSTDLRGHTAHPLGLGVSSTPPTGTEARPIHKRRGGHSEGKRWTLPTQITHSLQTTQHSPLLTQKLHTPGTKAVRAGHLNSCPAGAHTAAVKCHLHERKLSQRLKWLPGTD